jgi:serine/threonine protein kinase
MAKPFTIGGFIASGAFGAVHRGIYQNCDVAIKKILIHKIDPNTGSRECQLMQQLDHPNLLKLLHWQDDGDFRFSLFHSFDLTFINEQLQSGT